MKKIIVAIAKFFKTDTVGHPSKVAWITLRKLGVILVVFCAFPAILEGLIISSIQSEALKSLLNSFVILSILLGFSLVLIYMMVNDPVYYLPKEPHIIYGTIRLVIRYIMPITSLAIIGVLFIVFAIRN